jgi:PAS domain S-box-containing protein
MHVATDRSEEALIIKDKTATKQEAIHTDFRKSAEEIMISKFPASVVVNAAMDIVYIHGDITPFLQPPSGKPTHNLIKMAREGLAFELRNAIHKATKEQATVTKENIAVKANEKQTEVTIEIIPLTDTIEPHYLIRFEKKITAVVQEEKKSPSGKIIETQKQNKQLEKELLQTREDMRSISEDMEASNEELQSANEELQSSNEEMQSLNEELETSKEELQSTNEELIIVNQELLDKQEQLNVSHALQLEAHKRIEESEKEQKKLASQLKLATDSAKVGIWSLDIKTEKLEWSGLLKKMWGYSEHLDNLTLEDWAKLILPEDRELVFKRMEESKNNHSIYDAEYRIKRANDGTIAWMKSTGKHQYDDFGEAVTLTGINLDITQQKKAEEKLKATAIELATKNQQIEESEAFNRTILESSPDCLKVLDGEGRIQYMNFSGICQMEIDDFATIKNKYWWTLWGSENEALVKSSIDKAMKGETAHFVALCPTA